MNSPYTSAYDKQPDSYWQRERIGNASNRYQGKYKRVLAVCSGGLLRSPTIAHTLAAEPYNYNTRSVGIDETYALNILDQVLLEWADEIVCADSEHEIEVRNRLMDIGLTKTIVNLKLPDVYPYRDRKLVHLIKKRYNQYLEGQDITETNEDYDEQN
jgi:predicted protein tyrosine phosphatase